MLSTTIQCSALNYKLNQQSASGLKILFTTMKNGPASKPNTLKNNVERFIPNSVLFDFEDQFAEPNAVFSCMMPSAKAFQIAAQQLGLKVDDEIVIYDDFGNFCASRAWFMLISMGFNNVKTLDGGLPEWLRNGFATQAMQKNQIETSSPAKTLNTIETTELSLQVSTQFTFVNADYILEKINTCSGNKKTKTPVQIVDARSYGRFSGTEPEPRENMKSGHIPTSKNLHYASLQKNGLFQDESELKRIFDAHKINLKEEVIISCGSGVTACIVAQAAIALGALNIKVYDASWSEWGASKTLPVELSA